VAEAFTAAVVREISDHIRPLLTDMTAMSSLAAVTADKGDGHTAHEIDARAESRLFEILRRTGYSGSIFSEERGLVRLGADDRFMVCDPYCNTTLTFRGVRESAIAAYEFTRAGAFVNGAIADLQIPRMVWAGADGPAMLTSLGLGSQTAARCSTITDLGTAFVVVSMLKQKRRLRPPMRLLREAGLLTTIDGAIVAVRMAAGEVDAFVDATVGQPLYEVLAYQLVRNAGGTVTDGRGEALDFARIARALADGESGRQTVVAAATAELHGRLMDGLAT
jgi:fructose-1,6-bisphosphatase/inositol monophosphatase family enzyme